MACQEDKVDLNGLAVITVIGSAVCLIIAFAVAALLYEGERETFAKYAQDSPAAPALLKEQQTSTLSKYRTLDADQDKYAVPIERAMELVTEENEQD